jgi:hypothetical protein
MRSLVPLARFPTLFAHLVQRGADAIVVQDLFSFRSSMLETKFALNVRRVTKISRERQSVRHGKAVLFTVVDHLVLSLAPSWAAREVGIRLC